MLFYDGDGDCGTSAGLDPNLRWCLNAPLAFMLNTSTIWDGISRLSFFITYSNDVDAARACMFCGDKGAALWREYVSTWISAMRHPRYMKVTLSEHINPASPPTHTHAHAHLVSYGHDRLAADLYFKSSSPTCFRCNAVATTCSLTLCSTTSGFISTACAFLLRFDAIVRGAAESAGLGRAIIGGGWQNPSVPSFPPSPLPHPQGYMTYPHCDIECADCDLGVISAADASACMAACNSTAACVAFVAAPQPTSGVSCTLKSVAGPGLPPCLCVIELRLRRRIRVVWPWRYIRASAGFSRVRLERNVRALRHAPVAAFSRAAVTTTPLLFVDRRLAGCALNTWTRGGQTKPKTALLCSRTAKCLRIRRRPEQTIALTLVRTLSRRCIRVPSLKLVLQYHMFP